MKKQDVMPKEKWGDGPWQKEPDLISWEYKGLPCLMRRNTEVTGSWCGYVAVPSNHPAFEKRYDDVDVCVHGGLTYASHCQGDICHEPKPGESDNVWWLGFDCAHSGDLSPRMEAQLNLFIPNREGWGSFQKYRDMDYVMKEVESLANQLLEIE